MKKTSYQNKKGFTLIELLVVISIIGLLSSVVLASLQSAREKGRIAAGITFETNLYHALGDHVVLEYKFEKSTCSGSNISSVPDSGQYNVPAMSGFTGTLPCPAADFPLDGVKSLSVSGGNRIYLYTYGNKYFPSTIDQTNITVSFWLKTSQSDMEMFAIENPAIDFKESGGKLVVYSNNALVCSSSIANNDGKWHQFATSINSQKNSMAIYMDGNLQATCTPPSGYSSLFNSSNYLVYFPYNTYNNPTYSLAHLVVYDEGIQ